MNQEELKIIKDDIKDIKKDIKELSIKMEKVINICNRMNGHIDFVEDTYETLKNPLNYFKSSVKFIKN